MQYMQFATAQWGTCRLCGLLAFIGCIRISTAKLLLDIYAFQPQTYSNTCSAVQLLFQTMQFADKKAGQEPASTVCLREN